jgi:ZIP family zinc transporter
MLEAAFWGFIGASALVIGAEVAFAFKLSRMVIGLIMAFGIGTLVSSISFELVEESLEVSEGWLVGLGLAVGAVAFFLGDRAIARMGGSGRKNPDGAEEGGGDSGLGIALGSALDGIPETAALGISLAAGGA